MNPGLNIRILFEEWIERIRTAHTRLTMRRVHFAFVDDDFGGEVWYWEDHRGDWWLAVDRFGLRKRWHEPKLDTDGNVSYVDFKSLERFESQD